MDPAPLTPLGARTPHAHPAFAPVIAVLAAATAVGIYLALAYLQGWWPMVSTAEPMASVSVSPSPSGVPVLWRDLTYGFVLNLPESWRGFTVESEVLTANRTDGSGQTETFREFHFIHPKSTSQVPRQKIPIMMLTTAQWERIVREELSVGAAPFPPSELARNSKYVFALPARYNYAFYDGWEEVEAIMKTNPVSAFEPARPVDGPLTAEWLPFSSRYFTLSFKVPPGFDVVDSENSIHVSRGPFETHAIGSDNAFMSLVRNDSESEVARENSIHQFEMSVEGFRRSTVLVDGIPFVRLDGIDKGAFEGDSAGRVALVLFDKSALHVLERPGNADLPFDVMDMTSQILSTFRFAKVPYPAGPFKEASRAQNTVIYSGSATLSGTYELANEGLGGDAICFRASFPSYTQLPTENTYFCFSNQDDAERLLPVKRGDRCSYAGQATITITDYHANNVGKNSPAVESVDDARITSVARADAPQKNCW